MYIDLGNDEKVEIEELWSITECVLCKRNLTVKKELCRSKLLPCLHAMCHKCFVRCQEKGDIICHSCSFSFNNDEIYDNKVLYEIVSEVDIPKTKNIVCSIHDTKVTHWCENCNEFICPDCVKHHGQLKSTRTHTIITKDNYISKLSTGTPKTAFPCEVHPQNELSIICHSCRAMTCRDCQLEHHKDHKYDFIVDKADSAKNELYNVFKKIEFHSLIMTAALTKISDRETKIEDLKKKIVSDIKKEFDLIEEMIRKRANELMLTAVEKANLKLDECEQNRKLLKRNLNAIQHCLRFVKCVLYTSSDPVLYYTKDLMLNRMKNLHLLSRVPCVVDVINLSFSTENIDDTKTKIEKCGAILDCQDAASRDVNYWNSSWAALYSEFIERYKLLEEKELEDHIKDLLVDGEKSSDTIMKGYEALYTPEKVIDIPQNSILRQDESKENLSKEKQPSVRDTRAASGSVPIQNRPENNISLGSLLAGSVEPEKSVHQLNKDNSNLQTKKHAPVVNYSMAKTWHIPETVRLAPKTVNDMDMGNGVKRVRIPAQNPVIDLTEQNLPDYEALDQILKDLGAIEERENREREGSQEYQSPTGSSNDFWCSVCLGPDGYISCNNCPKGFHRECHIPTIAFPVPAQWSCILCQEICPLPPGNYAHFRSSDLKVANRLLLEMFCQVEASTPFRHPARNSSCMRSVCLLDIKAKLEKGRYVSIMDFIRDVKTMFNNCYRSRQSEMDVIVHAKSLEEIFNRLLSKFIPHLSFHNQ